MENINNEQVLSNNSQPKKKKFSIIKVLLIVVGVIAILLLALFAIYKSTVDISSKHEDKFDYNLSAEVIKTEYDLLDFVRYNSKENEDNLFITVPKNIIYDDVIKIHEFADDLYKESEVKLNKFGFISNVLEENNFDFFADITYKKYINAYVTGNIQYKITDDNGIEMYLTKIVIGDGFPSVFYKAILPIKAGDLIYKLNSKEYELLKDNVLKLSSINNVKVDKESLKFEFNYMSNLEEISVYLLGEDAKAIQAPLQKMMPIMLEMLIGDNQDEYSELASFLIPAIIGNLFN